MITIFHNNRCSKSRECLDLIKKRNINYKVIEYLKDDFNLNHIKQIVDGLEGDLKELIRVKEKVLKGISINFNDKGQIVELIYKYKVCMQRALFF